MHFVAVVIVFLFLCVLYWYFVEMGGGAVLMCVGVCFLFSRVSFVFVEG